MMTVPTIAIAIMIAAIAGTKYCSTIDGAEVGCGACVGAAGSTAKYVTACEGQYDSEPANEAYTVYFPVISGCQFSAKVPSLVVVLPISR